MPSGEILTPIMRPHLMLEDGEFELTVPRRFALVGMGGYLRTRDIDAFQREEMSAEELRNTLVPLQMGVLQNVMVDLGDTVEGLSLRRCAHESTDECYVCKSPGELGQDPILLRWTST